MNHFCENASSVVQPMTTTGPTMLCAPVFGILFLKACTNELKSSSTFCATALSAQFLKPVFLMSCSDLMVSGGPPSILTRPYRLLPTAEPVPIDINEVMFFSRLGLSATGETHFFPLVLAFDAYHGIKHSNHNSLLHSEGLHILVDDANTAPLLVARSIRALFEVSFRCRLSCVVK